MKTFRQVFLASLLIAGIALGANFGAPYLQAIAQTFQQTIQFGAGTPNGATAQWGTTANGLYGGTGFVGVTNHLAAGAGTVSTGTNATIKTGSSDFAGNYVATSTTSGITFATAFTSVPSCLLGAALENASTVASVATQPTYRVTLTNIHADVTINAQGYTWICIGKSGG